MPGLGVGHDAGMADGDEHSAFGGEWWEQHYRDGESGAGVPSEHLVAELAGLQPGTALDAGCGTGADAMWLAGRGWLVTAVDISATAVSRAETAALQSDPDAAARVTWVVADVTAWEAPSQFDLVVSQYVHPDVPFPAFVAHLAAAVRQGGTLFVAGHDHADPHAAEQAPLAASIGPEIAASSLDPDQWDVQVAETRSRQVRRGEIEATMNDVVVKARRR